MFKRVTFVIILTLTTCSSLQAQYNWLLYDMANGIRYKAIACADTNNCLLVGANRASAGVIRWTSDGSNWRDVYTGRSQVVFEKAFRIHDIAFPTPAVALASCDSGMVLRSTNKGITWDTVRIPTNGNFLKIAMADSLNGIIAESSRYLWETVDGGLTWAPVALPAITEYLIGIDMPDPGVYLLLYSKGGAAFTMRTTDGGSTWESGETVNDVVSIDFVDREYGWLAGSAPPGSEASPPKDIVYSTTNGGMTWTRQLYQDAPTFNGLFKIAFFDRSRGIAVGNNATIMRTIDGGWNWIREQSGLSTENSQPFVGAAYPGASRAYVISTWGHFFRKGDGTPWPVTSSAADPFDGLSATVSAWPNPVVTGETINLTLVNAVTEPTTVSIVTMMGVEVLQVQGGWPLGRGTFALSLSGLAAGTYFVKIQNSATTLSIPVVVY